MNSRKNYTQKKALIIGDIMLDVNTLGECNRISPEAPVPILKCTEQVETLGGAGNILVNMHHLNVPADIISVTGDDKNSNIIKMLSTKYSSSSYIFQEKDRVSTVKNRLISDKHQMMRVDTESTHPILQSTEREIITLINQDITQYSVIVISDYNKGVCTPHMIKQIIKSAQVHDIKVVCDPKKNDISVYSGCYILTPNKKEMEGILKTTLKNQSDIKNALEFMSQYVKIPLITLSEDGIAYIYNEEVKNIKALTGDVVDVTGAGDTVVSVISYGIYNGLDVDRYIELANKAASMVVKKSGTHFVTEKCLTLTVKGLKIITNVHDVKTLTVGKKIVFTNGCFDILHSGHTQYLSEARKLGDILIIGVNSDKSIKQLKGDNRPINDLQERMQVLSSLECVDYIMPFDEQTPLNLIKQINPDTLVKGGDYKKNEIVGSDIARETVIIPYKEGCSTTSVIKKIQSTS